MQSVRFVPYRNRSGAWLRVCVCVCVCVPVWLKRWPRSSQLSVPAPPALLKLRTHTERAPVNQNQFLMPCQHTRNLVFLLDHNLQFKTQIRPAVNSCYSHLRQPFCPRVTSATSAVVSTLHKLETSIKLYYLLIQ